MMCMRSFADLVMLMITILILALLFGKTPCPSRHVGSIDPYCNVVSVINDAFENARFLCDQYYLVSPDLIVKEHNGKISFQGHTTP